MMPSVSINQSSPKEPTTDLSILVVSGCSRRRVSWALSRPLCLQQHQKFLCEERNEYVYIIYICIYMNICIYTHTHINICVCVCVCVCVCNLCACQHSSILDTSFLGFLRKWFSVSMLVRSLPI